MKNKEQIFELYSYHKSRKDVKKMGLVVLNILELKLDDYFRSIDSYFM